MRFFLLTFLLITFFFPALYSYASPPIPQSKKDALESFDTQLEEKRRTKDELKASAKNLKQDLKATQSKLINIATSIQAHEKELQKLDNQIEELENEQEQLQATLLNDQVAMADMIMALQRIRRLPPEALLVRPDTPLKTAQGAMLLQNTLPDLYQKAQELRENLEKSETLSKELKNSREKLSVKTISLQKEHRNLSVLAEKREQLYRSTQKDIKAQEKAAQQIAARAKNLKDLVKNLDKQRKKKADDTAVKASKKRKRVANKTPAPGQARLPIAGVLKTRYNQPDNFGAPSKGIDIEGRGGALVVAPMGGVIRYAGAFKNYGQMVIIEHSGGYHSLVAGLERIDTVVGQSVTAGEPLGILHYAQNAKKPVLYYELRYNGKAVNPARKFSGLT